MELAVGRGDLSARPVAGGIIPFEAVVGCRISLVNRLQSSGVYDDGVE